MSTTLKPPFFISSRLLAAVKVGETTISIDYDGQTTDGRVQYVVYFDFADGTEHAEKGLKSGVGGGSLKRGMEAFLSFLAAAAESHTSGGENADLFPPHVVEWAYQHSDEIACLQIEIEETEDCCVEAH